MEEQNERLAVIAIVVEDKESALEINTLLHEYGKYIIGRMGVPYPARNISLISVAIVAPGDVISALTGKLGRISGVTVKTAYSKV
ncbi:MAG: iron-only hydrogenase system regulator [Parasporobacterium sp.]|nr:iron-only hydrogenase system regulator [Parasporobacterium sp.]